MASYHQQVRRRSNGTIDVDFYREQALTERAEVMTAFFRGVAKTARSAIASALTYWDDRRGRANPAGGR